MAIAAATARAEAAEAALAQMTGQRDFLSEAPIPPKFARSTPTRRREQDTSQQVLSVRTDVTSGQAVACVAAPCTISGVCLNGGVCEEVAAGVGDALDSFHC